MKRHLNTLYITTQGAWLAKEGEAVAVRIDGEVKLRMPVHLLEGIVCFGHVGLSPQLMHHCAERGIGISFLSEHGRFLARVEGPVSGNVLLRRAQYRWADDPLFASRLARSFVLGKIANCRTVLQRGMRDHPERTTAVGTAISALRHALRRAATLEDVDQLRGVEGEAAATYFPALGALLTVSDAVLQFSKRSRRPPLDPFNALLSFLYTLLLHDVRSALEAVGLDPQIGFLHRPRPGRPSLALDLMEELRPYVADRLALTLLNRRQLTAADFEHRETGAVFLTPDARKTVLVAYQERKRDQLRHPFLDETCTIGALCHLQALLLARHIRGDLDLYPPFLAR